MQSSLKRRRSRTFFLSWPILTLLMLVSVWMSTRAFYMYRRYTSNLVEFNEIKEKQEGLSARISYLDEVSDRLGKQEGIEEEIRARLPYAKEGEQVIFIVNDASTTKENKNVEDDSRWWQIWRLWR